MYDLLEIPANMTLVRKMGENKVYVERWIDKRTYRVLKFRGHYHSVPGALKDAEIGTLIRHNGKTKGKFHNGNFHDVHDPEFDPDTTKKWGYCAWYHMNGILYKEPYFVDGVEHGMHQTNDKLDPQDMLNMGGLAKRMPTTYWTFVIGGFSLAGFPFVTAGFWSKDEILADAFAHGHWWVFVVLLISAFLTAFYTMRQISLTFLGDARTERAAKAHESTWTMTLPLVVLSFFAVFAGYVFSNFSASTFSPW